MLFIRNIISLPRLTAVKLIEFYQRTLSPDHSRLKSLYPYGFCRHEPTCSEYGKLAIQKHGIIIGSLYAAVRLLSCNPFAKIRAEKIKP